MYKVGDKVKKILKEERDKQMTFPEMVQKLIDGEFEVGTELVSSNRTGTHVVAHNKHGYGFLDSDIALPSYINATWTVKEELPKEQPIKEISIEELQKELGYKIKIVERESK